MLSSDLMLAFMILAPCAVGLLMALLVSALASDERLDTVVQLKRRD
jgi:hypothetical protein